MSGVKKYNKFILKDNYAIMLVKYKDKILEVYIDIEDIEKIKKVGSWHAILDKTLQTPNYYICHREPCIKLHRYIMNCPREKVIDHINHNTLDNRKCNLRICTIFENQQNLRSCKTGMPGISFRKDRNMWQGTISKNNKRYRKESKNKELIINWRKNMLKLLYDKT